MWKAYNCEYLHIHQMSPIPPLPLITSVKPIRSDCYRSVERASNKCEDRILVFPHADPGNGVHQAQLCCIFSENIPRSRLQIHVWNCISDDWTTHASLDGYLRAVEYSRLWCLPLVILGKSSYNAQVLPNGTQVRSQPRNIGLSDRHSCTNAAHSNGTFTARSSRAIINPRCR